MFSSVGIAAIFLASLSWAQTQEPAASPQFEAASVKPAAPPGTGRMMVGMRGGPGSPDPGRINYDNVALRDVIALAYNVKNHQITGPVWLGSERFDITATIAPGTSRPQFQLMLQNLLAERFKLVLHHEKKELPAFVLTVGKKGPKMKQSEEPPAANDAEPAPPDLPPLPPPGGRGNLGKDGFPELPTGGRNRSSMIIMPGRARLIDDNATVPDFADRLSMVLNRPVVDQTELHGKFDFVLYFTPDMSAFGGRGGPPLPPPLGTGPPGEVKTGGDDNDTAPTIFTAVQEQLGLKLDSQKAMVDVLVIDHLEKVPTEN